MRIQVLCLNRLPLHKPPPTVHQTEPNVSLYPQRFSPLMFFTSAQGISNGGPKAQGGNSFPGKHRFAHMNIAHILHQHGQRLGPSHHPKIDQCTRLRVSSLEHTVFVQ